MSDNEILKEKDDFTEDREKVLKGILGAFLLSLIGGAVWVGAMWIDIFPYLCGMLVYILAIIGYRLFTKKYSVKGLVIAFFISLLMVMITTYFCLAISVYYAYREWYLAGEYHTQVSFFEAIRGSYQFLVDPEIRAHVLKNLGLGFVFVLVGVIPFALEAIKRHREAPYN